jgi:hypothetical protein
LLILLGIAACGRLPCCPVHESAPSPGAEVIARVDEKVLTRSDLDAIDPTNTLTADEIGVMVQNWIERELLMKLARQRGIPERATIKLEIEEQTAQIIFSELGSDLRREHGSETMAQLALFELMEETRDSSLIEAFPWKVR